MHQLMLFVPEDEQIGELRELFGKVRKDDSEVDAAVCKHIFAIGEDVVEALPLDENNWHNVLAVWLSDSEEEGLDAAGTFIEQLDVKEFVVEPQNRKWACRHVISLLWSELLMAAGRIMFNEDEGGFTPDKSREDFEREVDELLQEPVKLFYSGVDLLRQLSEDLDPADLRGDKGALRLWRIRRVATMLDKMRGGPFACATPYDFPCLKWNEDISWEDFYNLPGLVFVDMHT